MQPTLGSARIVRAGVLGTATLALTASAHLFGGGRLPEPWVLVFVALATGALATAMTAGRCRLIPLIAALGGMQFVVHTLFGAMSGPTLHAPGAMSSTDYLAAAVCGTMATGGASHFGVTMLLGHGIATLATAALLARGEAWLFSLTDRIVQLANPRVSSFACKAAARIVGPVRAGHGVERHRADAPRGPPALQIAT